MNAGYFITLEGVEGAGKSTSMAFLKHYLQQQGIRVVVTREPGGTPLAEEIREVLLQHRSEKMDGVTELLLVFAARAQHFRKKIKPALDRGEWVLCDRFTDATFAYQGGGRGLDMDTISQLEIMVQGTVRPDLTLLLDIDVEAGLARARKRGQPDRFEGEALAFFQRIRSTYLQRAKQFSRRYRVIDAGKTVDEVQYQLQTQLSSFLKSCPV